MRKLKRIWRGLLTFVAILVLVDAVAFFTIVFLPDSEAGQWLARHEPVFNLLQGTSLRSREEETSPPPPTVDRSKRIRFVEGDHYVRIGPGHPIFSGPSIESDFIGKTTREVNLKVEREQDGWFQLQFSSGKGWIHPFVTARFVEGGKGGRGGESDERLADAGTAERDQPGSSGGMQIEIRVEPDDGRRPDAIYFENLGARRRPVLFNELFSKYDPADLAALPPGADPARLQLATQLLGEKPKQKKIGDFILRYQNDRWGERSARVLKGLRQTYRQLFGNLIESEDREQVAYIFLLPNMKAYKEFYPEAMDNGSMQTGGHYEGGLIAVQPGIRGTNPNSTIVHEAVHHYDNILLGIGGNENLTWLDEGLATYFGLSRIDSDGTLHPGEHDLRNTGRVDPFDRSRQVLNTSSSLARIILLQQELRRGYRIRIAELLNRHGDAFYKGKVIVNYSAAWLLVHYLLHGKDGAYRETFFQYIDAARRGPVSVAEFANILGVSITRLEDELRAYAFNM